MQTLTQKAFLLKPPGGLFDETVVTNLFPDSSEGARRLMVYRACAAGEVLRLRPGLFVLAPPYRHTEPHPFVVAAMLFPHSNISFETALGFHGLIPEAVFQVACSIVSRSRRFDTPLGVFEYIRIPMKRLRAGVESTRLGRNNWAFVASPLRAIADMVYANREITWSGDGLAYLVESLRIEEDDLAEISFDRLDELLDSLGSRRVKDYLTGLKGALNK